MVGYHVLARFRDMNGNDVAEIRCAVYKKNVLEESKRGTYTLDTFGKVVFYHLQTYVVPAMTWRCSTRVEESDMKDNPK